MSARRQSTEKGYTATDWRWAFEDLQETLAAAQQERHLRQDWVEQPGQREIGWVVHERQVMTARVNLLRSRLGLPPVPMTAVAIKENLAEGHIDYTKKWAIGCADLVYPPGSERGGDA